MDQLERKGQAYKRLIWVMLLRVLLISVLLGATLVLNYSTGESFSAPSARFLLGLIAFTYLATIGYAIWYRLGIRLLLLARLQFLIDAILWGCLAYATGGIASGFTFLFHLWIIVAAVVLGGRAVFVSAGFSSVVLVLLALSMELNLVAPLSDQVVAVGSLKGTVYFLGINVVSLFLVAVLVNSLVGRLERTGKGLEHERAWRADLTVLHSDIIKSLSVGLVTTGEKGEITGMNPEGRRILGLTDVKIEGDNLIRWIPELRGFMEGARREEDRGHCVGLASDGRRIPMEYVCAPLQTAKRVRRGSIVIFSDLSKVKRLEAALEQARKLAALGELAASLAHEIRNPLSAVYGSFQMLSAHESFNEEDRSLSEIILREIRRIERLVEDMLEYARPRNPELREVELGEAVSELVRAFSTGSNGENVNVEFIADGVMNVPVDGPQIRQVLWNLLRNAAQAAGDDGTVRIHLLEDAGGTVLVEVEDDGPGIDPADRNRVFDPFYSTRERGLGLGLAICARIVEGHGASLEVEESELGGALFRLKLSR